MSGKGQGPTKSPIVRLGSDSRHSGLKNTGEIQSQPESTAYDCRKIWPKLTYIYSAYCGMNYGYARVSTGGQSVDAQVRQLTKAGCRRCSARWQAARRPTARSFAACSASIIKSPVARAPPSSAATWSRRNDEGLSPVSGSRASLHKRMWLEGWLERPPHDLPVAEIDADGFCIPVEDESQLRILLHRLDYDIGEHMLAHGEMAARAAYMKEGGDAKDDLL